MQRREFLRLLAFTAVAVPFGLGASWRELWGKLPAGIKITGLKTFLVSNMVFVKLYTSEGVTGLGEGTFVGRSSTVEAAIREHERLLIGRDPTDIELLWQQMARWPRPGTNGPMLACAISAIDIALWDIMGKLLDVPIYKLLGGAARKRARLYVHLYGDTPEELSARAKERKAEGFTVLRTGLAFQQGSTVVKRPWDIKLATNMIKAIREAAGDDIDIMDDPHGLMTPVMVMEYAKAVEPYRLFMLEDPVQPDNLDGLRWINQHTTVPIGIGESIYTKQGFKQIVSERLASYVRPDVIRSGGITECRKIAAMAEANYIDMALHVAPSPVSNFASLHLALSQANCVVMERSGHLSGGSWMDDLFMGSDTTIKDGHSLPPEKPGLGTDLDEKVAAAHPYEPGDLPHFEFPDGSVSDW